MTSDFRKLLQKLYSLQRLGIKTGLRHTYQLLDACSNPQDRLRFIHLAGTNGKGSTAAFIFSILRTSGLKVGLYTSPHLIKFNERIRINGIPISDEKIVEFMNLYSADIECIESTFFETTSAMAFWYFEQEKVDIVIVEAGLGGRLDSTNVIQPEIAVITPVSMDHHEILGSDLKSIAKEKAGIIKDHATVVSSAQENVVREILIQKATAMNAELVFINSKIDCTIKIDGTYFNQDGSDYRINLIGEHQAHNAALAVAVVRQFEDSVYENFIKLGLEKTVWPGRFQVLSHDPVVIYDVAHNEQGITSVLKTLNHLFKKSPVGLFALKEDKQLKSIAKKLVGKFEKLFVIDDEQGLLMKSETLSMNLSKCGIDAIQLKEFDCFTTCLKLGRPGIIFGSHYIAEAIFKQFHFSFDSGVI